MTTTASAVTSASASIDAAVATAYRSIEAPQPLPRPPWQLLAAVVICLLTLFALALGFLKMSQSQIAARDRLENTVTISRTLDRIQAEMIDGETGARGFALVGREVMLDPYHAAKASYAETLDALGPLIAGDRPQERNLAELRELVRIKWDILDTSIEALRSHIAQTGEADGALDMTGTRGKVAMDKIRVLVATMQQRETLTHDELQDAFHRAILVTRIFVISASVIAMLTVIMLYAGVRRFFSLQFRASADLAQSEERYRILTEVAPQIVWMADTRGNLTFCNQRWVEYTGMTLEETMQAGAAAVVHDEDRSFVRERWRIAINRDVAFEAEVRLRRSSDGVYRWHLSRARPVRDANGQTAAWFGAATDIDDRKRAELALDRFNAVLAEQVVERTAALEQRTGQLKALNRNLIRVSENERARLARELHDEIGSHLSVAMMDLTLITRRLDESGRSEFGALIGRLSDTLKATTQISRRIITDLRPVAIRELGLAAALDSYCAHFEESTGIRTSRHFAERMPLLADEAGIAVFRIVQESLSNVVKHAEAKEVRLTIHIEPGYLVLRVEDDGLGMTQELRNKLGSHGLLGIRERAEAFGGELLFTTGLGGRGTGLTVKLSLASTSAPAAALP